MGKTKKRSRPRKQIIPLKDKEPSELVDAPHSFIIHRGLPCPYIKDLTLDMRKVMEPFTAAHLREKKINRLKDFVSLSGFFHVTHMGIFNKASTQLSFRLVKMPRGPTLTFKVHQFTLCRDVLSASKRQFVDDEVFKYSPLVIMNNFSGEGKHLKLMATTFQNMFPAINIAEVEVGTIRRCVLFSYNSVANVIEMRHYTVQVLPVGLTRGVKKIIHRKIPNLAKCSDIADFILQDGAASESEYENDENSQVVLPQTIKGKGNLEDNKSAIQLHEIGPRLTMQLMKIEDGLLTGEVLYHDHVVKTEEEKEALRKMVAKKKKLKEQRKKIQEENRERNLKAKEKAKREQTNERSDSDDDAKYYREEVGEEPDEELFKMRKMRSKNKEQLSTKFQQKNAKKARLEGN